MLIGTRLRAKSLKTDAETLAEPERKPSAVAVRVAKPSVPACTRASAWDLPKGMATCWETLATAGSDEKRLTVTPALAGDGFPSESTSWTMTTPEPPGGNWAGVAVSLIETGGSRLPGMLLWVARTAGIPTDIEDSRRSTTEAETSAVRFTLGEGPGGFKAGGPSQTWPGSQRAGSTSLFSGSHRL